MVPLIDNEFDNEGAAFFINKYLSELLQKDQLLITSSWGTHYPLIINGIKAVLPSHIKVISQGTIVAESLDDYLRRHPEIETNPGKTISEALPPICRKCLMSGGAFTEKTSSEHAEMEM